VFTHWVAHTCCRVACMRLSPQCGRCHCRRPFADITTRCLRHPAGIYELILMDFIATDMVSRYRGVQIRMPVVGQEDPRRQKAYKSSTRTRRG
jgi:hypothetical protein